MNTFMTPLELRQLTGASRASRQAAWLSARRIPFLVDGKRVVVYHCHVQAHVEGRPVLSRSGPNWAAVV